jgi:hypothetical protein
VTLSARIFAVLLGLDCAQAFTHAMGRCNATLDEASCWKTEATYLSRLAVGYLPQPAELCFFARVYSVDFNTAATNEASAAQMDQPSPRDSITITTNAAPAASRRPIPCGDR